MTGLWDAHFRARMLRQALSNDEMAQAVEAAEALEAELSVARAALDQLCAALVEIAAVPEPINRNAAPAQCEYLKRVARCAVADAAAGEVA